MGSFTKERRRWRRKGRGREEGRERGREERNAIYLDLLEKFQYLAIWAWVLTVQNSGLEAERAAPFRGTHAFPNILYLPEHPLIASGPGYYFSHLFYLPAVAGISFMKSRLLALKFSRNSIKSYLFPERNPYKQFCIYFPKGHQPTCSWDSPDSTFRSLISDN